MLHVANFPAAPLRRVLYVQWKKILKYRKLRIYSQKKGVRIPYTSNTPYVNTIALEDQPRYPGDYEIERNIRSIIRWNAMAMVVRANRIDDGIGGHISTYVSAATLYSEAREKLAGFLKEGGRGKTRKTNGLKQHTTQTTTRQNT